jgi:hypothetical protein
MPLLQKHLIRKQKNSFQVTKGLSQFFTPFPNDCVNS